MGKLSDSLRKIKKEPFCSAVIVASGASTRAGKDKIFALLGDKPVLAHTLLAFEQCECIQEIILVVRQEKIEEAAALCNRYQIRKVRKIVCGGDTRTHSALSGVAEVNGSAKLIAIHDGARPLITRELIGEVVHNAALYKAAAPALPVKDTLKHIHGNFIVRTISREETMGVQTPQAFDATLIKGALTDAVVSGIPLTDDCSAVERFGAKTRLVPGDEENLKLTTPVDFLVAEAILESRRTK